MADMPKPYAEWYKLVGKRLALVRRDLQRNKQQMADSLKVKHDRWSKWENGSNLIPPNYALELRRDYGVSMEWLYSDDPKRVAPEYFPVARAKLKTPAV